jgi:fibronectin type III domain protein
MTAGSVWRAPGLCAAGNLAAPTGKLHAVRPILYFLFSILLAGLAVGCAAPSEPTARHAPIPTAITDLSAVQQGHRVILTLTLPKKTTDAKPLPADPSIEIYRLVVPAGAKVAATPAFSQSDLAVTIPSAMVSHYADERQFQFPFELKSASVAEPPGERTVFMVRTRVSEKKASADSNAASLHLYGPFPPAKITAKITHDAIILSGWGVTLPAAPADATASEEIAADARYRVYRGEVTSSGEQAQSAASGAEAAEPRLVQIAELPLTTLTYEDANFTFEHTYVYSVRSAAKYGSMWVESDDSNLLTVTPKDVFPPAAPQGLVIVFVPANADVPAHLELSWSISAETDLAGYDIYRKGQDEETGHKLNDRPLLTPSYRDMSIQPGRSYSYTVRAVDRAGNESPASEPASIDVPGAEQNGNPQP